jgi:hypothetical protein
MGKSDVVNVLPEPAASSAAASTAAATATSEAEQEKLRKRAEKFGITAPSFTGQPAV